MCTQLSIDAIVTVLRISLLASLNDSYKDTMTERRKCDCNPHKRIRSNIAVASLRWLLIIMLHEKNGLFFFAKIFLAIKLASLMMFWSFVFSEKNEFDWYF